MNTIKNIINITTQKIEQILKKDIWEKFRLRQNKMILIVILKLKRSHLSLTKEMILQIIILIINIMIMIMLIQKLV